MTNNTHQSGLKETFWASMVIPGGCDIFSPSVPLYLYDAHGLSDPPSIAIDTLAGFGLYFIPFY